MFITQESDYAMRIVYCLAKGKGRRDARSISEEVNVTLRFSLKILGKLSNAGIVNSFKGNRGGYELARPAAQITLRDILGAVEGPYILSRCLCEGDCSNGTHLSCGFQTVFGNISDSVNSQMAAVSIQDILDGEATGGPCGCGCAQQADA